MARCSLGAKKLRRYSRILGIEFVRGFTRGNTNHRVDLYDKFDNCISVYPNKWRRTTDVITAGVRDYIPDQGTLLTLYNFLETSKNKDLS